MLGVDTEKIQKLRIVLYQRIMLTHLHLLFNYLNILIFRDCIQLVFFNIHH